MIEETQHPQVLSDSTQSMKGRDFVFVFSFMLVLKLRPVQVRAHFFSACWNHPTKGCRGGPKEGTVWKEGKPRWCREGGEVRGRLLMEEQVPTGAEEAFLRRCQHDSSTVAPRRLPVSLQVNLALGSHILLVPSQPSSSPPSSQSLSPSHRQRSGMQVPSVTQWNSSSLHSITDGSTETKGGGGIEFLTAPRGSRCKDAFRINESGIWSRNKRTKDCEMGE